MGGSKREQKREYVVFPVLSRSLRMEV